MNESLPGQHAQETPYALLGGLALAAELVANEDRDLPGVALAVDLAPAKASERVEAKSLGSEEVA